MSILIDLFKNNSVPKVSMQNRHTEHTNTQNTPIPNGHDC